MKLIMNYVAACREFTTEQLRTLESDGTLSPFAGYVFYVDERTNTIPKTKEKPIGNMRLIKSGALLTSG